MTVSTHPRATAGSPMAASGPLRSPATRRARAEQLIAWFAFVTATVGAFALTLLPHA